MPNEDNIIDSVLNAPTATDNFDPTIFINDLEPQLIEEGNILVSVTLACGSIREIVVKEDLTYLDDDVPTLEQNSIDEDDMREIMNAHAIVLQYTQPMNVIGFGMTMLYGG